MAVNLISPSQAYPVAATPALLYACPSDKTFVASSLFICNQSQIDSDVRVSVRVGGVAASTKDKLFYGAVEGYDTISVVAGITLRPKDQIWVESVEGTVSFNLFGQENSL